MSLSTKPWKIFPRSKISFNWSCCNKSRITIGWFRANRFMIRSTVSRDFLMRKLKSPNQKTRSNRFVTSAVALHCGCFFFGCVCMCFCVLNVWKIVYLLKVKIKSNAACDYFRPRTANINFAIRLMRQEMMNLFLIPLLSKYGRQHLATNAFCLVEGFRGFHGLIYPRGAHVTGSNKVKDP